MKAFAPSVSIRFIHDPVGDPGLFHCLSSSSLHCFTCRKISASRLPAAQLRVVGKRLARQLRCHAVCSFSLPSHPNPFPAVMPPAYLAPKHNDVAVMPGATAAGVPPASCPARPGGLLRPTRSCCASPLRACRARTFPPPGAPSCFVVPQSRHSPSLRDGTVTTLGFGFLSSFAPATGRPRFARTSRRRAHFPSPPGRRRRPLRGDCFAPAACHTFSLSPSRQTSLRSDCLGGCYRSDRRDPPAASLWTGHVSALLLLMVLREAADTCCAVTAASLRSSFFPAPLPGDLASLGRPEAELFCAVLPYSLLSPPEVGDRRLRAFILSLFVGATHA